MAAISVQVPFPIFYDRDGLPLDNGDVYIGVANLDPITNPIQAYYDQALTITANQPLKTSSGYIYRNGTPTQIYVNATDFSITVNDSKGLFVYNSPTSTSVAAGASSISFTGFKGQVGTVADLADADGSDWIGYTPSGTGAVARSAQDKMRDSVSVQDFGAVGNGVANDTAAIQLALNTGKSIFFVSGKTYKVTGTLSATGNNQIINLNGAKIDFNGASNGFSITGGLRNVTICDGEIEGQNMTGGYVISIINADRSTISNVRVYNPFNFLYVQKANVCDVTNAWVNNIRGAYGIHWFGNAANRSDILRLIGVNLSSSFVAVGIMWDGNCNTLQAQAVTIVQPTIGVHIRNTSGGSIPAFGLFDDLEVDFPSSYGIKIDAGEDFYFSPLFYCHGSTTASGVYVGAAVPDDRVIISGGKITSHATYGIENYSRVMAINLVIFGNTTANYYNTDEIYSRTPRFEVDGTSYFSLNSGNPIVNWDVTDTDGYIRSTNVRYMDVNGITRFQASNQTDAIEIYVNGVLKRITVSAVDSGGVGFRMLRVTN